MTWVIEFLLCNNLTMNVGLTHVSKFKITFFPENNFSLLFIYVRYIFDFILDFK